jgi:hypothetical protein
MNPVLAYIDAGSGSLIVQALIAALVAAPFIFRQQLGRVARRLRGEHPTDGSQTDVGPTTATQTDTDPEG